MALEIFGLFWPLSSYIPNLSRVGVGRQGGKYQGH